jgi:hypothetical protein
MRIGFRTSQFVAGHFMSGGVGICNWIHSDLSGRFFQDLHCKWMSFCKSSRPALPAFLSQMWCLGGHDFATDLAWQDLTSSDMNKESLLEACAAVNVYRLDTSWASVLELDQTSWSITFLGRDWCIFCCPGQSCPTQPPCYFAWSDAGNKSLCGWVWGHWNGGRESALMCDGSVTWNQDSANSRGLALWLWRLCYA